MKSDLSSWMTLSYLSTTSQHLQDLAYEREERRIQKVTASSWNVGLVQER